MIVNANGSYVSEASYLRARRIVADRADGSINCKNDVLASLREMVPRWNITTITAPFHGTGHFNMGIHPDMLSRAANDPDELIRLKALMLDADKMRIIPGKADVSGMIIYADGGGSAWGKTTSNGEETSATVRIPRNRSQEWAEILLEKLEEAKRLERSRERRLLFQEQSEQVDYLSQEDYKTALDSMAKQYIQK